MESSRFDKTPSVTASINVREHAVTFILILVLIRDRLSYVFSFSLGGTTMFMFRKTAGFARFMVWNGMLTIGTTFIIVLVIRATLGGWNTEWPHYIPTFLFVLIITTLFFFLIYSQGRRLRSEQEQARQHVQAYDGRYHGA